MSRKPAMIFDFGNVIAFFDYGRASEAIGSELGISGSELLARLVERGFKSLLVRYESGQINDQAFFNEFSELADLTLDYERFVPAWSDIFQLNPSVAELVGRLRSLGYTLVLGSNTNAIHAGHFTKQFEDTLRHFDALVLSYQVGHVKPSREFYLACAESAGRSPADCVFIDDLAENIDGARAAGLQGLVYVDTPRLIDDLRRIGVSVEM